MSVTIDQELLDVTQMGLQTIGQVLSHLQRDNRLITNLLIDGQQPDLSAMGVVRRQALTSHVVYIETSTPRTMALEVLYEVELQLQECDRLKGDAIESLQRNSVEKALEKLKGCFTSWQHAQESVVKTAQLLRIDLEKLRVGKTSLAEMIHEFTFQLRGIKSALENRDYVVLTDILTYEATETNNRWRQALDAIRETISATKAE